MPVNEVALALARRRARVAAWSRISITGSTSAEWEQIATWVETGSCDMDCAVRILCVELVATHLRTGLMNVDAMLKVLQQLRDFALPETPPAGGPGASPRRSAGPSPT